MPQHPRQLAGRRSQWPSRPKKLPFPSSRKCRKRMRLLLQPRVDTRSPKLLNRLQRQFKRRPSPPPSHRPYNLLGPTPLRQYPPAQPLKLCSLYPLFPRRRPTPSAPWSRNWKPSPRSTRQNRGLPHLSLATKSLSKLRHWNPRQRRVLLNRRLRKVSRASLNRRQSWQPPIRLSKPEQQRPRRKRRRHRRSRRQTSSRRQSPKLRPWPKWLPRKSPHTRSRPKFKRSRRNQPRSSKFPRRWQSTKLQTRKRMRSAHQGSRHRFPAHHPQEGWTTWQRENRKPLRPGPLGERSVRQAVRSPARRRRKTKKNLSHRTAPRWPLPPEPRATLKKPRISMPTPKSRASSTAFSPTCARKLSKKSRASSGKRNN